MMQAEPFADACGLPVSVHPPGYAGVANLTRVEVPGENAAIDRWLKVTAACRQGSPTVFTVDAQTFTPEAP